MADNQQAEAVAGATTATGASSATLKAGRGGILGVKAGMTQVYNENGDVIPVTVIDLRPNVITQIKTSANEGYSAVQIGFLDKKEKRATKAEQGHAKKVGKKGFYHYQEFRLPDDKALEGLTVGQTLTTDFITEGGWVDLTSVSKGKGFQGVMKRYNFAGGPAAHGASICHRQIGSIGNRADPGKVFKGKKMPGHMGHKQVTIQNAMVVKVDSENGLLLVNSSIPGPKGSIVTIRRTSKTINSSAKKAE
jgi:large subunit ribosomal protein L3